MKILFYSFGTDDTMAAVVPDSKRHQGPLLLTWFNFNPSMDK